jgi:hypothetical protein
MWPRLVLLLALSSTLLSQGPFANPDFVKGSPGGVPEGWFVPTASSDFQAVWVSDGCQQGKGCAEIAPRAHPRR